MALLPTLLIVISHSLCNCV